MRVNVLDGCRGSSPLTRGKRDRFGQLVLLWGLIPAHAGKTSFGWESKCSLPAHPRSRGENAARLAVTVDHEGSSPLTRGKRGHPGSPLRHTGLIPAHAGKTTCGRAPRSACRAHPRSRGENVNEVLARRGDLGSSPLTRGKRRRTRFTSSRCGLIPAHAGKTGVTMRIGRVYTAHPRSRGENPLDGMVTRLSRGSSPLTRGKHFAPFMRGC